MPLTQDRMIAIVREAESVRDWGIRVKSQVADALAQEKERIRRGETPREATSEILALVSSLQYILDTNMRPPCEALAVEAAHFRRWSKRNEREKQRATQRRRYRGVPEGTSVEGSRTKFAPKAPPSAKEEWSIDENPEITTDDVMGMTPPHAVPPTREELIQWNLEDKQIEQEMLLDPEFRAKTSPL